MRGHPTKVAGYVPIAALGVQAGDPVSAVPTLVLWGSLDAPESERAHAHAKARLRFCAALRPNVPTQPRLLCLHRPFPTRKRSYLPTRRIPAT